MLFGLAIVQNLVLKFPVS